VAIGSISDVLGSSMGAICAIALALSGAGIWSIVAQVLVAYGVRTLIAIFAAPVKPSFYFSLRELRPHLSVGGSIIGTKLVDTGDRAIENVLIGRGLGSAFLGSFSLANQVARFLSESVLNTLWLTLYVQALRSDDDVARFQSYKKLVRVAALILCPAATLMSVEADDLIVLLLGSAWKGMSPLFQLLLLSCAITTMGTLGTAVLYAKGRSSIQLRITAEVAVIRIMSVMLAPWTGLWTLWLGLPIANLYTFWRSTNAACKSINGSPTVLIAPILAPGACAVVAGLACWAATRVLHTSMLLIIIEVASCFALYLLLLFTVDRKHVVTDVTELVQLMRG